MTTDQRDMNLTVVEEPAMVTGFIPSDLYDKLRRMAATQGCSESHLVSRFVKRALSGRRRLLRTEPQ